MNAHPSGCHESAVYLGTCARGTWLLHKLRTLTRAIDRDSCSTAPCCQDIDGKSEKRAKTRLRQSPRRHTPAHANSRKLWLRIAIRSVADMDMGQACPRST